MKAYIDQNQERWDRVSSRQGNPYTIPYSHEELQELKDKPIEVALTVGKLVPLTWFEKAKGKDSKDLCLQCTVMKLPSWIFQNLSYLKT